MRLLWLPAVLKAAGLRVTEVGGWRTRGDSSWGPIRGVTCHATAGARNGSTSGEISVLINGSATAPAPIAQLYLARDGRYHVVASGMCFHNLQGWGGPNNKLGNANLIGIEAGNDNRGEPWPPVQLDAYRRGVAAICRHLNIPASRVAAHREHQPGDKSDPVGINMTAFRAEVARLIEENDMPSVEDIWTDYKIPKQDPDSGTTSKMTPAAYLSYMHQYTKDLKVGQAALLAAVAGDSADRIRAIVSAELAADAERERKERAAELADLARSLAEPLATGIAARLGDRDAEEIATAVVAVLGDVLTGSTPASGGE